jgi:hypothetical protein
VSYTLGSDKSISIVKNEVESATKKVSFFGYKKITTQEYLYKFKNNSKSTRVITIIDYIPVSNHSEVEVKVLNSEWKHNPQNGEISLEVKFLPGEEKNIKLGFQKIFPEDKFY